jgi:hypothetical protein
LRCDLTPHPGARGETGAAGEQGRRGPIGPRGFTGATGREGATGANGQPGPQGQRGAIGPRGLSVDATTLSELYGKLAGVVRLASDASFVGGATVRLMADKNVPDA